MRIHPLTLIHPGVTRRDHVGRDGAVPEVEAVNQALGLCVFPYGVTFPGLPNTRESR